MGVDAGSVYTSIRIRLTDLDNDLKGVYSRLDQLEANITKTTVPAKKNFKDMFAAVVTGQAALGLAKKGFELLVSSIKNSINVASESQEMISKYGEVFDGMGGQAEDAAKRFADSFDLAGATAKEMLANTGNLLQGMGATKEESLDMSVAVNTLASDLASFTNNEGGASAASEAITKALLGEKESMKTLGIAILDSDVNARVAKNGQSELTGTALKLAKAQATLQLITEQASNAIGDYARTSDSVANSQKRAAERTKELQIAIGTGLGGAVKLASNLWSGFAEGLTKVINRSSSIGKLTGVTDDLIASSREYNTITNTLTSSSNNLSEAERGVLNARKDLLAQQISQQAIELAKAYKDEYTALGKAENKIKGLTSEQSGLIKKQDELKQYILNVDKIWSTLTESEKDAYRSLSDSSGKYTSVVEKDEAAKIYITSLYRDSLTLVQRKIGEVNSKLIDSTNTTNTFKNKNQEALYAIARAVNDGTISIAQFSGTSNAGYTKFYNDVMAATVEVKEYDKAIADANADTETGTPKLTAWQEALQSALNVKNISSGKSAVSEYIATTNSDLEKAVEAAKITGGDVSKVYSDYADKVNDAITQLIMSGQYVASESTIQSLKDFAASVKEVGATSTDNSSYEDAIKSLERLTSAAKLSASAQQELNLQNEHPGWSSEQIDEYIVHLKLLNQAQETTIDWETTWENSAKNVFEGLTGTFETAASTMVTELAKVQNGEESWGEASANIWGAWGNAALGAIAAVVEAIGQQLAAKAGSFLISALELQTEAAAAAAHYDFVTAGTATAASAAALSNAGTSAAEAAGVYGIAGLIRGLGSTISLATGGIVAPSSSGTLVRVAENGSAEGIFNAGESGKALIDSFTSSMLKNMGTNNNNNQTIILKIDGTTLAKIVTRKQRNGD